MPLIAAIVEQIMKAEILSRVDVDAGATGGLGVAADGVDVPAVAGAAEDEGPEDQQRDRRRSTAYGMPSMGKVGLRLRFWLRKAVMPSRIDRERRRS